MLDTFIKNLEKAKTVYSKSNWNDIYHRADYLIRKIKEKTDSKERRYFLIHKHGFSIMVFSSIVMSLESAISYEQVPFVEKLEIDVRGQVTPLTSNGKVDTFIIEIGEIKKSDSTKIIIKGYRQLWLRLAVIGYALSIIAPDVKCNLIGNLYTPKTDKIFNSRYDDGFTFVKKNKGYNYYVNHITI